MSETRDSGPIHPIAKDIVIDTDTFKIIRSVRPFVMQIIAQEGCR